MECCILAIHSLFNELSLKDGIDLGCCAYDHKNQLMEYAGAFNPLYLVRNNEITGIRPVSLSSS